jgi:hypothetical protein
MIPWPDFLVRGLREGNRLHCKLLAVQVHLRRLHSRRAGEELRKFSLLNGEIYLKSCQTMRMKLNLCKCARLLVLLYTLYTYRNLATCPIDKPNGKSRAAKSLIVGEWRCHIYRSLRGLEILKSMRQESVNIISTNY